MYLLVVILTAIYACSYAANLPLIVSTWANPGFRSASQNAWDFIKVNNGQGLGALVEGLVTCQTLQCDTTVGYGGSPDEDGETTLDALVMDGTNHQMGAVGALRRVKDAARVAWAVMNYTQHSLLVGDQATAFAVKMGFINESLTTNVSIKLHKDWLDNKCQPNFWQIIYPAQKNPLLAKMTGAMMQIYVAQFGSNKDFAKVILIGCQRTADSVVAIVLRLEIIEILRIVMIKVINALDGLVVENV
uniref:N(4)-(Beta-N-acetylglucosaminyl)-L-asparaginase n=1 Tax=Acrobeloides nanus TaxID=290746 RepID=A0A914DMF4_9BILA